MPIFVPLKEVMKENACIRVFADTNQISACKHKLQQTQTSFERLGQILNLAGNEIRLKILFLLEEEAELCVCDLSDILGISIPAVSQHLRKLKDAQILKSRKTGQTIFYSLRKDHMAIIKPLLEHITQRTFSDKEV